MESLYPLQEWCRTGDGRILSRLPPAIQKGLVPLLQEGLRRGKRVRRLARAGLNQLYPYPPYHVSEISGPTSITHHRHLDGREIYLFGEVHLLGPPAYLGVEEFLFRMIRQTPVVVDLFLERAPYDPEYRAHNLALDRIEAKFAHCLQEDCLGFEHLRYHHTDIRSQLSIMPFVIEGNRLKSPADWAHHFQRYRHATVWIEPLSNQENLFRYLRELTESELLQRELRKMSSEEAEQLTDLVWSSTEFRPLDLWRWSIYAEARAEWERSGTLRSETIFNLQLMFDSLTKAFSLVMDLYLLARLFRTYKGVPSQPRHVIIYVGEAHARTYRQIFPLLGFEEVERVSGTHSLDLTQIKPFFT